MRLLMNETTHAACVLLAVAATALVADATTASAQSAELLIPSQWEASVTPTVQKLSPSLAGDHVWSGGVTLTATRRVTNMLAVEAQVRGSFAPQLNMTTSAVLNLKSASTSVELHRRSLHAWDPYIAAGVGMASFKYPKAPFGLSESESWVHMRGALGIRYALTDRINWRAEMSQQFGKFGGSPTLMSGLSLRFNQKVAQ